MASTLTNLLYHLVFSTKGRLPLIGDEIQQPLYDYIGGIIRNQGGKAIEISGMPDHVHCQEASGPQGCFRHLASPQVGFVRLGQS